MHPLVVRACVATACAASMLRCAPGAHAIAGGRPVSFDEAKRRGVVGVQTQYRSLCSGTLVGPDLVLTARHCLDDIEGSKATRVIFGNDIYGQQQSISRRVTDSRVAVGAESDLALLKFKGTAPSGYEQQAVLTELRVPPTARVVVARPTGQEFLLFGLGRTAEDDADSAGRVRRAVGLGRLDPTSPSFTVTAAVEGQGQCTGDTDSGGPAFLPVGGSAGSRRSLEQVGVLSTISGGECAGGSSTYVSVAANAGWLLDAVRELRSPPGT
jgi:hypothetical protein